MNEILETDLVRLKAETDRLTAAFEKAFDAIARALIEGPLSVGAFYRDDVRRTRERTKGRAARRRRHLAAARR